MLVRIMARNKAEKYAYAEVIKSYTVISAKDNRIMYRDENDFSYLNQFDTINYDLYYKRPNKSVWNKLKFYTNSKQSRLTPISSGEIELLFKITAKKDDIEYTREISGSFKIT